MEWQVKAPTWDFDVLQVGSEPSVARRAAHTGAPAPEQQHQLHHPTWGSFPAESSFNPLAGTGNGNDEQQQRGSDGNVAPADQRIVAQDVKGSFSMLGSGSGTTALYAAGSSSPIVSISNVAKAQEHEAQQQQQLLVPFHSAHESEPGKLRSSSWQLMFREKGEESENDDRQLLRHVHQDGIAAGVASSFPHNIDFQHYQQRQPHSGEMQKPRPVENTGAAPIIKAGSIMLSNPIADSISCDTLSNAGACKRPSRYGGREDQSNNGSQQPNAGNVKKCRASSTITSSPVAHHAAAAPPRCQVEGCREDLAKAKKDYHRRHKVCEMHSKAPRVIAAGVEQRFCQQCSRFHLLSEFDDAKRSCRKRLAGHNERRRKSSQDASALSAASIFQDDRLRHLSYLMHPLAMALPLHYHDSCNNSSAGIASTGAHAALRRPWPMTSGWPGMEADNHFATTLCRAQALTNNGASVGGTAGAAGLLSSLCSTNSTSTSTASRLLSALQAHDNNNNNHLLPLKYHDHQMHENAPLSSPCNNNNGIVNNVSMGEGLALSSSNGNAASSNSSSSQGPNSNTSTDTNNNHSMQFMASLEAAAAHHQSGLLDSGRALSLLSSGQAALNHIPSSRPTNSLMIPSQHVAPNPNNLSMHLHNPRNDHNPVYNAHNHSFSAALADHPHFSLPRAPHHQEDHHLDLKPSALNALSSSPSANCNNAAGQQLALSIGTSANGESPTSQQNGSDAVMGAANKTLMSATNSTNLFQALAGSNPDILARLVQQTQHHQQQSSSTSSEDKLPSSLDDQRPTSMQPVELLLSNSSHHHHHLRLADTFPSLSRSAFEPSLFTAHSNL